MKCETFIEEFKSSNVTNASAIEGFIKKVLNVKEYIPFNEKKEAVNAIVKSNITDVDGIKHYDSMGAYIGFVMAMIIIHTDLEFGTNPIQEYDMLSEAKLLYPIISTFKESYDECEVLLKMSVSAELESNNLVNIINTFLNKILDKIDSVVDKVKESDISKLLGEDIKQEDFEKLIQLLNVVR